MMKSSRFQKYKKMKGNIIKDARNLFRLKKEIDDTRVKDVRNLFRLRHHSRRHKRFCYIKKRK